MIIFTFNLDISSNHGDTLSSIIDITDFQKVDLRVGIVEKAERIPGSRKLLRLIVNLGSEKRQLIAGIAEYYKPEDLINKYVVVVVNLKPKKFMGFESQGMVLAANCVPGKKPVLLTVMEPVDPGAKVC